MVFFFVEPVKDFLSVEGAVSGFFVVEDDGFASGFFGVDVVFYVVVAVKQDVVFFFVYSSGSPDFNDVGVSDFEVPH